jgi:hypothetical protein
MHLNATLQAILRTLNISKSKQGNKAILFVQKTYTIKQPQTKLNKQHKKPNICFNDKCMHFVYVHIKTLLWGFWKLHKLDLINRLYSLCCMIMCVLVIIFPRNPI